MDPRNRLIWITGASSGIGEALAYELSRRGARLVLSSRREDTLEAVRRRCVRPADHHVYPLDLSDARSLESTANAVHEEIGPVDVLVNNGGISQRGTAAETEMSVVRRIMEVNFFGTVHLTKAVLPVMRDRQQGHIVVVSSLLGKFGLPTRSTYAASKHALHGWFDSLRTELHDENVGVTMVCPGYVKTNIAQNALTETGTPKGDEGVARGISPEECAEAVAEAIEAEKLETYVGGWEVFAAYMKRLVPTLFYRLLRRYSER